jgi:hypothetical protein
VPSAQRVLVLRDAEHSPRLQRDYFKKVIAEPESELYRLVLSALAATAQLPSFGAHFSLALMIVRLLRVAKASLPAVRRTFLKDLQRAVRPVSW